MIEPKLVFAGISFLLTLIFGFVLSHVGKPYNVLLFNIHKLAALSAVALAVIQFWRMPRAADSYGLIVGLLVVAALCVIALFASGALMSAGKLDYATMLTIHRIASPLLALGCALALYFLVIAPSHGT